MLLDRSSRGSLRDSGNGHGSGKSIRPPHEFLCCRPSTAPTVVKGEDRCCPHAAPTISAADPSLTPSHGYAVARCLSSADAARHGCSRRHHRLYARLLFSLPDSPSSLALAAPISSRFRLLRFRQQQPWDSSREVWGCASWRGGRRENEQSMRFERGRSRSRRDFEGDYCKISS